MFDVRARWRTRGRGRPLPRCGSRASGNPLAEARGVMTLGYAILIQLTFVDHLCRSPLPITFADCNLLNCVYR
jgi:hypothetical protein